MSAATTTTSASSSSNTSAENQSTTAATPTSATSSATDTSVTTETTVFQQPPLDTPKNTTTGTDNTKGGASGSGSGTKFGPGAVAGISIGTAIAGALIGVLLFMLIMSRRSKRGKRSQRLGVDDGYVHSASRNSNGHAALGPAVNMDLMLAQALDDGTIKAAVDSLRKRIEDHVDSRFYLDGPIDEQSLPAFVSEANLAIAVPGSKDISQLLKDRRTRLQALKAVVAANMLATIDFEGSPDISLLPKVVTTFLSQVSPHLKDDHANRLALSRWRTSTCHLLSNQQNDTDKAEWRATADRVIHHLNTIIQPYADPQYDAERNRDLSRVCSKVTQVGMQLLSQPAEWMFYWALPEPQNEKAAMTTDGPRSIRGFVTFPGLVKVTDESARMSEQIVLNARVARVH